MNTKALLRVLSLIAVVAFSDDGRAATVLYWGFDQGNRVDAIAGAVMGGGEFTNDFNGMSDSALYYEYNSSKMTLPSCPDVQVPLGQTEWTLLWWMKSRYAPPSVAFGRMKSGWVTLNAAYALPSDPEPRISRMRLELPDRIIECGYPPQDDAWHLFAITRKGPAFSVYVDAAVYGHANVFESQTYQDASGLSFYQGLCKIDDLTMTLRCMDSDELKSLYEAKPEWTPRTNETFELSVTVAPVVQITNMLGHLCQLEGSADFITWQSIGNVFYNVGFHNIPLVSDYRWQFVRLKILN